LLSTSRELKLEFVPRNDKGELIDPEKTSVVELFRIHWQKVFLPPFFQITAQSQELEEETSLAGSLKRARKAVASMSHLYFKLKTLVCRCTCVNTVPPFFSLQAHRSLIVCLHICVTALIHD
jgi:hypothetical protein